MTWRGAVPSWRWWLIALVLVAGGQQYRVVIAEAATADAQAETARAGRALASYRLEISERDRRAAAQTRTEEQRRQKAADEEGESAQEKLDLAESRAATAESAAGGMRGEIERLRADRAATCDTIASQQRKAGASAVVVLGGLLEEADRMAGSLAEALGRSRIAGQACETIADRMKGKKSAER